MKTTVFLAHAQADHEFAREAADFLESGCEVVCDADARGQELPDQAEEGLSADVLLLLLSEAACGAGWKRDRWAPVLESQGNVVSVALGECRFPALLRRKNFFDATAGGRVAVLRMVKRWFRRRERQEESTAHGFSHDLEELYSTLADRPGVAFAGSTVARKFALEAGEDFEAVIWAAVAAQSSARIAGHLGAELGLVLEGTADENLRAVKEVLSRRRCLLVTDSETMTGGRTSVLVTDEIPPVEIFPDTMAGARGLLAARRYAEAYELLYRLMHAGAAMETCARELAWICDAWNWVNEADELRDRYHLWRGEQLSLW